MPAIHPAPFLRLAAAGLITTACATIPSAESWSRAPLRSPYSLTAEEISRVHVNSAYEAIERLKPHFLVGMRGQSGSAKRNVYLNGTRLLRGVEDLRMIEVSTVEQIVFLSAIEAGTLYGSDNSAGAILVSTQPDPAWPLSASRTR